MFAYGMAMLVGVAVLLLIVVVAIVGHVITSRDREWRFDMARVISNTFTAIGRAPVLFFGTAIVLGGGPEAVLRLLGQDREMASLAQGTTAPALWLGYWVVAMVASTLLQVILSRAAVDALEHEEVEAGAAIGAGFRLLLPGLALAIASVLAYIIGFLLFVIPGIVMICMWMVVWPVLVAEPDGVGHAFGRSADLTSGARWTILLLLVISGAIYLVLGAMLGAVAGATGMLTGEGSNVALAVVSLVTGMLGAFPPAGAAAIYHELRTQKEGAASGDLEAVFA